MAPTPALTGPAAQPVSPPLRPWRDPVLWGLLVVAGLLLAANLDRRYLWQDEAETALLARSILRHGVPRAYDGVNHVSQEMGVEYDAAHIWRWSPWVQFYLAAGSLALWDQPTVAPRLPFVLLGLTAVPLTYLLGGRLFGSRRVARLSTFFLALSVPFLLHVCQARWYAPAYALVAALLLALAALHGGKRSAAAGVAVSLVLLFYTNYFVAIGLGLALLGALPFLRPDLRLLTRLTPAGLAVLAATLPGLVYFRALDKGGGFDPELALTHLKVYAGALFTYLLPLPVLALLICFVIRGPGADAPWGRWAPFLLAFTLLYLLYLTLAPWAFFRYLSVLLPAVAVLLAAATARVMAYRRPDGYALLALLTCTDLVHMLPLGYWPYGARPADRFPSGWLVGSPLLGHFYELTQRSGDSERTLCDHLTAHARPGDVVVAAYGDLTLQYYTGLQVVGGLQGRPLPDAPDWVHSRTYFFDDKGKGRDLKRFFEQQLPRMLDRYGKVPLPGTDPLLGTNPDPRYHLFRTPRGAAPLILLRKAGSGRATLAFPRPAGMLGQTFLVTVAAVPAPGEIARDGRPRAASRPGRRPAGRRPVSGQIAG